MEIFGLWEIVGILEDCYRIEKVISKQRGGGSEKGIMGNIR